MNGPGAGCRYDGWPTSWQAIINPGGNNADVDGDGKGDAFREFYFEYTDFQHAYEAGVYVGAGTFGEYNGQFDERNYVAGLPAGQGAAATTLDLLFYPVVNPGAAPNLFPASLGVPSDTFRFAIAPPLIVPVNPSFPDLSVEMAVTPANGALSNNPETRSCIMRPCPTSIDFLEPGMFVVNYRNEPVGLRIYDPNKIGPGRQEGRPGRRPRRRACC